MTIRTDVGIAGFFKPQKSETERDVRADLSVPAQDPTSNTPPPWPSRLSPADARLVHRTLEALPGSALVEIRVVSDRPAPETPARPPIDRDVSTKPQTTESADQLPLFACNTPGQRLPAAATDPVMQTVLESPSLDPETETSTQAEPPPEQSPDEPMALSPEIPSSSAPEPEPEARAAELASDEISQPPASYDANLTAASAPQPVDDLDRTQRLLVWATVEIVRSRRTGRPLIALKVSPSPATNTEGVRFRLEERLSSAGHKFKVLKEAADLGRGFRLITPSARVRLVLEVER